MTKRTLTNQGLADKPVIKVSANQTASTDEKVLLLAVTTRNGITVITPLDLESEGDDQTPLSQDEQRLFRENHAAFTQYQEGCEKGLKALHTIFAGRLPREKFASFENYCFALHNMGISEEKLTQLKVKANRLRLNGAGCQKGGL
jgi:hypothetical protein